MGQPLMPFGLNTKPAAPVKTNLPRIIRFGVFMSDIDRIILGASLVSLALGAGCLVYAYRLWLAERDAKAMAVGAILARDNNYGARNQE